MGDPRTIFMPIVVARAEQQARIMLAEFDGVARVRTIADEAITHQQGQTGMDHT